MLSFGSKRVYLACGYTDMRKHLNGLSIIIDSSFQLDLYGESVFVFCNRSRDRIKIVEWDGDGFWLYSKRLEKGRFKWPQTGDEPTMIFSPDDFHTLLNGARVEQKLKRNEVLERKIV
jgi:transposase